LQGFKEPLYRLRAGDYRVVFKRSGVRIDIVRVPDVGPVLRRFLTRAEGFFDDLIPLTLTDELARGQVA
jgi:hypothetical protein